MLILVTGATGKVGRHFIAGLLDDARFSKRAGSGALSQSFVRGNRPRRGDPGLDRRAPRRGGGARRRHACRAPRDLQRNAGRRHGRHGQRAFLAARGISAEPYRPPVYSHRRRCRDRSFPLSPRRANYRRCAAPGVSGKLRIIESSGRGDAGAVRHPIRHQRLLSSRAVDHGEGRLQVHAVVRRRRVRRAGLEDPGPGSRREALRQRRDRAIVARRRRAPAEAQFRARRGPGFGDIGCTRQSASEAAALQHLHGPACRLWRGRRLPRPYTWPRLHRHSERVSLELDGQQ